MKIPRMSFNTGEIAPLLHYRSDLAKYSNSCKKLENFINMPQGSLRRRFGTQVAARIADNTDNVRIIVWEVDRLEYFQLIFIGTDIQVYDSNGALVYTVAGIPWADTDFELLYFKQVFDVMYIAHPDYPLQQLKRTATFVWTVSEHEFLGGPFGDPNTDTAETMTMTVGVYPLVTVTSSSPQFKASDIGRFLRIIAEGAGSDADNYNAGSIGVTSTPLSATGTVTLRTEGGIWDGKLVLQESTDGGTTWDDIGSINSVDGNHNGEIERDVAGFGSQIRVDMRERAAATGDTGCKWTLDVPDIQYNYIEITGFTNTSTVDGTVQGGIDATVTAEYNWTFGVYGADEGYPACIEIHEERLMLGGALAKPATVYGSRINNWNNFQEGTLATSPIAFSLSADVRNRIRWMVPEQELILGTDYGEWTIGSRDINQPLSGENVSAKRQTQFGTEPIQPVVSSDMTLYVEAGGRRLRSAQYSYEKDGYISIDMSILAPHLTQDFGIKRMAFSRSPDQIVWAIREDGELMAFAYERENGVSAWSRHPFSDGGQVLDMNSILTNDGDVVSLLVNRDNGLYFEVIQRNNLCFDWYKKYSGVLPGEVITLKGNENFNYYNDDLVLGDATIATNPSHFEAKESGIYLYLLVAFTDLIVIYDGNQIDLLEDIVDMGTGLYWLPFASVKALVVIKDGAVTKTENVDYRLDLHTEVYVVDLLSGLYNPSALTIEVSTVVQTVNVDYWNMETSGQMLLINMDLILPSAIVVKSAGVPLTTADYNLIVPQAQIAPNETAASNFYAAIEMKSEVETTDLINTPENGGGGVRGRIHRVDTFVVDSVGGEVSGNGGDEYEEIKFIDKVVVAGERIPEYTGKLETPIQHGYQDGTRDGQDSQECTVSFRNKTPYNQILAAIGAELNIYSQ